MKILLLELNEFNEPLLREASELRTVRGLASICFASARNNGFIAFGIFGATKAAGIITPTDNAYSIFRASCPFAYFSMLLLIL